MSLQLLKQAPAKDCLEQFNIITEILKALRPVSSQDTSYNRADRVHGLATFSTSIFHKFTYFKWMKFLSCAKVLKLHFQLTITRTISSKKGDYK